MEDYMDTGTVHGDMSDTSIRVSSELADELFDQKQRGETYEDVIWRLIEQAEQNRDSDEHDTQQSND